MFLFIVAAVFSISNAEQGTNYKKYAFEEGETIYSFVFHVQKKKKEKTPQFLCRN
jgi:hypothetical protein